MLTSTNHIQIDAECPAKGKLKSYVRLAHKKGMEYLVFQDTVIRLNLKKQEKPLRRTIAPKPSLARTLFSIAIRNKKYEDEDFKFFKCLEAPFEKKPVYFTKTYITSYFDGVKQALENKNIEVVLLNEKRTSLSALI